MSTDTPRAGIDSRSIAHDFHCTHNPCRCDGQSDRTIGRSFENTERDRLAWRDRAWKAEDEIQRLEEYVDRLRAEVKNKVCIVCEGRGHEPTQRRIEAEERELARRFDVRPRIPVTACEDSPKDGA